MTEFAPPLRIDFERLIALAGSPEAHCEWLLLKVLIIAFHITNMGNYYQICCFVII